MASTAEENNPRFRMPSMFVGLRGVPKADLPSQILAGVTLAALMIPLNIGYAQVAGLPPIVGLYAAIVPSILWAIFSTSRNLVASPDAPIAALIGSLLATLAVVGDPHYAELAYAQALICALFFFLAWFFRLGGLANFLSQAVLVGFITGLGIEVLLSQIQKIMGVSIEAEGFFRELGATIAAIPQANWYSVALGVGTIVIIRLLKRFAPRLPGPLIALILMTAVVSIFSLNDKGVSVLGEVPSGLPTFGLPQVSLVEYAQVALGALAIVGVTMAEGLLIARKYAQKYDYKIDPDQELFAFGMANLGSGFTGGLAIGSSASRTAAMDDIKARSQIPSLVAGITVAIVVLFFTDLLALLPNAVLGGIVANSVVALIEIPELRELFHMRRSEFAIAIVCTLSVLVFGALPAVIIAFILSTIDVVRRAARPHTAVLSALPDGAGFYDEEGPDNAFTAPGLIVFRLGASLFFANSPYVQERIETLVEQGGDDLDWFVLDAESVSDIDTTGAETLRQIVERLKQHNITFAITRANEPIPDLLAHYELLDIIGEDRIYLTNRAAAEAFTKETGRPMPELSA